MACPLQNGLNRLLENERKSREKSRAKFLKEMGISTVGPSGIDAPKPKRRPISSEQILNRFADMPVRHARPTLLAQMIYFLSLEEQAELQKLIEEAASSETVVKPIDRPLSKPSRSISTSQILARFQQMKVHRPQLVFDLSNCLTQREKRTLQDLIDSAFRAARQNNSRRPTE